MSTNRRRATQIVLASAVTVVLAGLLAARLTALAGTPSQPADPAVAHDNGPVPQPPPAVVPEPEPLPSAPPKVPCWACPEAREWPIQFRTDLDVLAPLGTGTANAAVWFAAFEARRGARWEEAAAAEKRRVPYPRVGQILPADDPLLREAAPWVDQATMRFYPEIFPLEGLATRIPNLLFSLTLVRSWIARGMEAQDSAAALADFRRAIRLGRLIRQEDVTLIADLVGIACIRIGADAVYERAVRDGNDRLALVAAIVAGEAAPQRLLSAARITEADITAHLGTTLLGRASLELPAAKLDTLVARAAAGPDRRLRIEPMCTLALVGRLGTSEQRARATGTLEELSRSEDPIIAGQALHLLDWRPSNEELRELVPES